MGKKTDFRENPINVTLILNNTIKNTILKTFMKLKVKLCQKNSVYTKNNVRNKMSIFFFYT